MSGIIEVIRMIVCICVCMNESECLSTCNIITVPLIVNSYDNPVIAQSLKGVYTSVIVYS